MCTINIQKKQDKYNQQEHLLFNYLDISCIMYSIVCFIFKLLCIIFIYMDTFILIPYITKKQKQHI
jgi:hypothetical protein